MDNETGEEYTLQIWDLRELRSKTWKKEKNVQRISKYHQTYPRASKNGIGSCPPSPPRPKIPPPKTLEVYGHGRFSCRKSPPPPKKSQAPMKSAPWEGCGGLGGKTPRAFPKAGPIFQQPFSLPESSQTLAGIEFHAAGKSGRNFSVALKFAGNPSSKKFWTATAFSDSLKICLSRSTWETGYSWSFFAYS